MKAMTYDSYGPPEVLHLGEVDLPPLAPREVLVGVRAAGVDAGVWHVVAGQPYLVRLMGFGLRRPKHHVAGTDLAGTVLAVGDDVARLRVGEDVYGTTTGSFAERAVVPQDKLAPKPPSLGFEQAAALPVSGLTALQAVRDKGGVQPGQRVLVLGAGGGVGHLAVQIAKALGAEVTGACGPDKVALVQRLGADHVVDRAHIDPLHTGPFDVVIDTAGRRRLRDLRAALRPHGVLVLVGGEGGNRWTGGFLERQGAATLLSPLVRQRLRPLIASEGHEDLLALTALVESGQVTPHVEATYPLHRAAEAVARLHAGGVRGKLVVSVAGG